MAYMLGFKEIFPPVAAIMVGSGVVYYGMRNLKWMGGEIPTTLNDEWMDKTIILSSKKPREGSERTIPMEPFTNGFPPRFSVSNDGEWSLKKPKRSLSRSLSRSLIK